MKRRSNRRSRFHVNGLETLEARTLLTTLAIAEINYAPYEPLPQFGDLSEEANDYEFIEVLNYGSDPVDLTGVKFQRVNVAGDREGVDFEFTPQTLAPNERILVVENIAAFESRYGNSLPVAGQWAGGLSSGGEQITLVDRTGAIIVQLTYDSSGDWPGRAEGTGSSLELLDPTADGNLPDNWQSSADFGGTPGRPLSDRSKSVIFNEVLAHTDPPQSDAIEFYNVTPLPIDMSGWFLSDNDDNFFLYSFPDGSTIEANGYRVIEEAQFNPGGDTLPNDFALSEQGDALWLISADDQGHPDKFIDRVRFGATANGVSVGNVPNGVTINDFQPLASLTFGRENSGHRVGEVVITEINYQPPGDDANLEFIELRNTFAQLDLSGWRLRGGVDADIPQGTTLGVNETIVLVSFDPADVALDTAFRDYYGISDAVRLVGPWERNSEDEPDRLGNDGEKLTLRSPHDDLDTTLYVDVDQVDYNDAVPWPIVADGHGASLERSSIEAYGNDPSEWFDATPNPGNEPIDLSAAPALPIDVPTPETIGSDGAFLRGASDVDLFRFMPATSGIHKFNVNATGDLLLDPSIRVLDAAGTELAFNDDINDGANSQLLVDLQADTEYLVTVSSGGEASRSYDPLTGRGLVEGETQGAYEIIATVFESETPFQNPELAVDVDGSGTVLPQDLLLIINAINAFGFVPLPINEGDQPPPYLDVSGDNELNLKDAIIVINYLNDPANAAVAAIPATTGTSSAETRMDREAGLLSPTKETMITDSAIASAVDGCFADDFRSHDDELKRRVGIADEMQVTGTDI